MGRYVGSRYLPKEHCTLHHENKQGKEDYSSDTRGKKSTHLRRCRYKKGKFETRQFRTLDFSCRPVMHQVTTLCIHFSNFFCLRNFFAAIAVRSSFLLDHVTGKLKYFLSIQVIQDKLICDYQPNTVSLFCVIMKCF